MKKKHIKMLFIALRIIIAIIFILAGSGKFQVDSIMADNFNRWELGVFIMYCVGILEIIGAVLLLLPKTYTYGSTVLIMVMAGAAIIHFLNFDEMGLPLLNGALIILLILIFLKKP